MLPDYHTHTYLCGHASGTPEEYVASARSQHMPEICVTDHAPAPDGYDPTNRMKLENFQEYQRLYAEIADSADPVALYGIEADFYAGGETFLKPWLKTQEFDLVLGSVHYIGDWSFDSPLGRATWESVDIMGAWRKYFELIGQLADSGMFDMVAHLDLPKKYGHRPKEQDIREMAQPALDHIARAGMGIEISTAGLRRPAQEIYPSGMILELACERDIPICFGSDAHSPEEVGYHFKDALLLAKQAGYTHYRRFSKRQGELQLLPTE